MAQRKYKVKGRDKHRWSYTITIRDEHGNRRDITKGGFRTCREAKKAEGEKRDELEYEKLNPTVKEDLVTVDDLFKQLIQKKRHEGKREATINTYVFPYNKWFKDKIGSKAIREVSKKELQEVVDGICPYLVKADKPIAILKNIYHLAYQDEVVNRNLAHSIIIKKELLKRKIKTSDEDLKAEHIAPFFRNLKNYIKETKRFNVTREMLMYHLLLVTGMRSGEAIALRWSDIDFEQKTINITKSQKKSNNEYVEGETKTEESVRKIPVVNKKLYEMFEIWKEEQLSLIEIRGKEVPKDLEDLIFYNVGTMKRLKTSFYTETLNSFYRKNKDEPRKIKCHGFRHTFTSLVRQNEGCPEKLVALYLGHTKNQTMTDRYTHVDNTKELVLVADAMDKKLEEILPK